MWYLQVGEMAVRMAEMVVVGEAEEEQEEAPDQVPLPALSWRVPAKVLKGAATLWTH